MVDGTGLDFCSSTAGATELVSLCNRGSLIELMSGVIHTYYRSRLPRPLLFLRLRRSFCPRQQVRIQVRKSNGQQHGDGLMTTGPLFARANPPLLQLKPSPLRQSQNPNQHSRRTPDPCPCHLVLRHLMSKTQLLILPAPERNPSQNRHSPKAWRG